MQPPFFMRTLTGEPLGRAGSGCLCRLIRSWRSGERFEVVSSNDSNGATILQGVGACGFLSMVSSLSHHVAVGPSQLSS